MKNLEQNIFGPWSLVIGPIHAIFRREMFIFVGIALIHLLFLLDGHSAWGMGGRISYIQSTENAFKNWKTEQPTVVIAFGHLEAPVTKHYSQFARTILSKRFSHIDNRIQTHVIEQGTGEEVVRALSNPNTIGLIFISHTFHSRDLKVSTAISADGFPLPRGILSAATPALLFASILGCHGSDIPTGYQVSYEFSRIPGGRLFYFNQDTYLSAGFTKVHSLKKALLNEIKDLDEKLPKLISEATGAPEVTPKAELTIRAKDIAPDIEPRYLYVNDRIVGMLGSNEHNSNQTDGFEDFKYSVPSLAIKNDLDKIHIKIESSNRLSVPDHYLIESMILKAPDEIKMTHYLRPIPIGDRIRSFKGEL